MSLRWRLFSYLFVIHGVFFALACRFPLDQPWQLVGIELGLLLSLVLGSHLVNKILRPLDIARQFHDLLQDGHYATRFMPDNNHEINELARLFNHMLNALYQERLQLGEQRGFLDRLLEATPTAVIVFDFDGKISLLNTSALQWLGNGIKEGMCLTQSLQMDKDENVSVNIKNASKRALITTLHAMPAGGSTVWSDDDGRRFRCQRNQFVDRGFKREFVLIDEITAELLSSEKATYEKLIRVLAHEVNNTVAATGSVLESLLYYKGQLLGEDRQDFFTAIDAVKRRNGNLGEFIDRFTSVVKMPEPELKPHDLAAILNDIVYIYRQQCSELNIDFQWTVCDALPLLKLDVYLIEQALLNIVKNAVEAVEAMLKSGYAGQAYIHISLQHEVAMRSIQLSVIDSARLLKNVPHAQLFTPFFTTKKGGQGIGLMFVREVLNRHGFSHQLVSNNLGDTSFDISITY